MHHVQPNRIHQAGRAKTHLLHQTLCMHRQKSEMQRLYDSAIV
jgi:hypothetical protein